MGLPADELLGNRFCPGENSVGDPFLSNFVDDGGWKAEGKPDLEMLPGDVSDAAVVVTEEEEDDDEGAEDAAAAEVRNGLKAPAAAAAAAENGCLGSTKWWRPKGG